MMNKNNDFDWKKKALLVLYLLAAPIDLCCDDKTWTSGKDTRGLGAQLIMGEIFYLPISTFNSMCSM